MRLVGSLAFVRAFVACWTLAAATAANAQFDSFVFEMTLDEPQLEAKARELLVRYGARMFESYRGLVDVKKLEAAVEARAGPGVKDELARLRSAPEVAEFNKLSAPARFAGNAEKIVDVFEQYLILRRFRLAGGISPPMSGDDRLRKMRDEDEESIEPLLAGKHSAALARWLALGEIIREEYVKASDLQGVLRFGPSSFFSGVEAELAELCVTRKS